MEGEIDVVDYVMETPHNTNRTVLEGLVDTAVKEGQVQADWDQNDPEAKDYVKNRPGGYFIHVPVLGISEDITLRAISASGRRVLTNNGTVLVHYDIGGTANDKKYWILFAGSTNAQTASNGFVATEIYCNDVAGSFNGPWNQHYVSDLTNPLGLRNSQVGQIAEISGVDSNGKPTSWKTVDVLTTNNTAAFTPTADYHPATKKYVDDHTPSKISKLENDSNYIAAAHVYDGILISSSTPNSTKKFKITVDDTGALTATGVTEA